MKLLTRNFLITIFCLSIQSVFGQTDSNNAMKAWTDYMTPGSVHQMMAKEDGEWKTETSLWMEPGKPPVKSTGTCTNKMILGGRYQEQKHQANFMGMPMEGISTLGYDNAKKTFYNTWVDNMGTGIMKMEGTWDEASKTINFTGMAYDPMMGKDVNVRQTLKIVDDNNQLMQMYMTSEGMPEHKTMEMKLTRK